MIKKLFVPVLLVCLLYTSCSPTLNIRVNQDKSGSFLFRTELGAALNSTLNSLTNGGTIAFDKVKITETLHTAGLQAGTIEADSSKLTIEASAKNIQDILSSDVPFIRIKTEETATVLQLSINSDTMKNALNLIPPDTAAYAELLMAPVFTGETMTIAEYVDLLSLAYGAKPAEELKKSVVSVHITVPKTVKSAVASRSEIQAGFTKNTATFTMPLVFFLTNTASSEFTVRW